MNRTSLTISRPAPPPPVPPVIPQTPPPPPTNGRRSSSPPPVPQAPVAAPIRGRVVFFRLGLALMVILSTGLIWWSVSTRLMPATRELRDKALAMAQLGNEVQQLETAWNAEEVARTEKRYEQARGLLFANDDEVLAWHKDAEGQALGMALQPSAQAGVPRTETAGGQKLSVLPITVDIQPLQIIRTTNTPYRRFLTFSRLFERPEKRVDLVDLNITGSSNSVRTARLVYEVWSEEKAKQ